MTQALDDETYDKEVCVRADGEAEGRRKRLDGEVYDRDVYILAGGEVKKRKKRVAKEVYGTSHKIGPDELARICKGKPKIVFIGTGQQGVAELTEEGRRYLETHKIDYAALPTPEIVASYNNCEKRKAALIHVAC